MSAYVRPATAAMIVCICVCSVYGLKVCWTKGALWLKHRLLDSCLPCILPCRSYMQPEHDAVIIPPGRTACAVQLAATQHPATSQEAIRADRAVHPATQESRLCSCHIQAASVCSWRALVKSGQALGAIYHQTILHEFL